MTTLADLADETDRRAEEMEDSLRRLAMVLFAIELAFMTRALAQSRTDTEIVAALRSAIIGYRSPFGIFRRQWEDGFAELLRDNALEQARRALPIAGRAPPVPKSLPSSALRSIGVQAEELATAVTEVSAVRIEAAATAVVREISDRRVAAPPPAAPRSGLRPSVVDQRLESLVPLVGREAASEIIRAVRAGREAGESIAKVATSLVEQVHATEVTAARAEKIARTESMGLTNLTEHERAVATGVLDEKRWLSQRDGRVRDSHVRCDQEGWIPIHQRYSNGLMYPNERPSPPSETIHCRCSQAFRASPTLAPATALL